MLHGDIRFAMVVGALCLLAGPTAVMLPTGSK